MTIPINVKVTATTLAAATVAEIIPRNITRQYLMIQNTGGTNPASFGFDNTVLAGTGVSLDPASAVNGQGGSYEWVATVPTNPVFGFSTGGTTVIVIEG
jgi:hypothetical protein